MSNASPLGIDIGTTFTCVGIFHQEHVEIIQNNEGERKLPSCVGFPDTEHLIGHPVISASYFRNIKDMAEVHLVNKNMFAIVEDVVASVPASFSELQRRAIKDASNRAGLNVLRIINEPTAAAIGYCYKKEVQGNRKFLVFVFGGDGAFNVSIFNIEDGLIELKSSLGDLHLSRDFDNRMDPVVKALQDAKINSYDITNVIIVGSSTRVPEVQNLLCGFFGGKIPELIEFDVVAHGAAIKAAILGGFLDIASPFHALSLDNQNIQNASGGLPPSSDVTAQSMGVHLQLPPSTGMLTGTPDSSIVDLRTDQLSSDVTDQSVKVFWTLEPSTGMFDASLVEVHAAYPVSDEASVGVIEDLPGQLAGITLLHGQPADIIDLHEDVA